MEPPTTPARVVKVLGRVGARGLFTEVRVELLAFPRMQLLKAVKGELIFSSVSCLNSNDIFLFERSRSFG